MLGHGDAGDFPFLGHYKACWILYNLTPFHDDTNSEQLYAHSPIKWIMAYLISTHMHKWRRVAGTSSLDCLLVSFCHCHRQSRLFYSINTHRQSHIRASGGEVSAALPPETCTSSGDQLKKHCTNFSEFRLFTIWNALKCLFDIGILLFI